MTVVLVSGGMDSAVALAEAIELDEPVTALSVRYGSVHENAESQAAKALVEWYGVEHVVISLPTEIFKGGDSSLLGESVIPNEEYHDIRKESPSSTVVPFRNATLLSVATAYAEAHGHTAVYMAVHASDHGGWAYPDCSPEFIGSMMAAVYVGTLRKVRLVAPFLWMTKAQVVQRGFELGVPFKLTWSCYRGGEKPCGQCPTCLERLKAFHDAGYKDQVEYA